MKKRTFLSLLTILVLTIVAAFSFTACSTRVKNVNLNFVVDGQTISTIETSGKEVVAIPNNPEKEGYTFDGWYWDKGSWQQPFTANSLLNAPISSDMSVYAHFDTVEYTITYSLDGGSNTNPSSYNIETPTINLTDAVKIGYTFDGWYKESTFTNKMTSIAQGSLGNIELYAKFSINQYTISFDVDSGSAVNSITQDYNTVISTPTAPTKNGYTFDGWFENGSQTAYNFSTMPADNVNLKAKWTPIEYSINYDLVGGINDNNPIKYTIETETITLNDATKVGYTFDGWFDGTEKVEKIELGSLGNIELIAHWTPIEYTISYENTKSATNFNPIKFTIESDTITLVNLEKLGYTFNGWYNGAEKVSSITKGTTGNMTLTADWTVNGYEITYHNVNGAANSNPDVYNVEDEPLTLLDASKVGYTFIGWYTDSKFENGIETIAVGTTGNKDFYAKWEIIIYTITYINDDTQGELSSGDTLKTQYTIEDNFDFPVLNCKITGYEFSGWYTEKTLGTGTKFNGITAGMIGDKTFYSQYAPAVYTITYYNADGVSNTNPTTYTIETENFVIDSITKIGYTFEGWYSDSSLQMAASLNISKGSYGNIELYAKWNAIVYTINYNLYGGLIENGENPEEYTIENDITFINPTQGGKYFVGWYTSAENGDLIKKIIAGTTGNITLYARWLEFDSNGGTAISYNLEFAESGVSKPMDPTKEYYDFVGWYFDEQLTNNYDFNSLPVTSSTLYAKWETKKYTITYVLNDGTNSSANPTTYTVEDSVTFVNPSKTGYTFNGWYSNANFTSALITGITVGSHGDITIYANFGINKYTISFNSNGGTTVDDITQNYDTNVIAPANPAKNGYSFGGWYSDSALGNAYSFTKIPAYNLTLYAKWNLVAYEIVYNLDGGNNASVNPANYTIESSNIILSDPAKRGYTFAGWYTDSTFNQIKTEIANGSYGDIELFAKWQIITYSVTYSVPHNTENNNVTEYTVATNTTTLSDAVLTGYTFNGWYKNSSYTQAVTNIGGGAIGDITLYGKFTANKYNIWLDGNEQASCKVSFNLNGANGTAPITQNITETNTLKYPDIPTRSGYLFCGWYSNSECNGEPYDFSGLVASDITLYAKWESIGNANVININGTETVRLNGTTEKVYKFIPLVSGNVSITSIGSIDTLGSLYKGSMLLKMDDDSGSDSNFLIVYNVTAGEVYDIHVRGFSSSINGNITLSLTGVATIAQDGYSKAGNKSEATFDSSFTLPVPEAEGNYKFLGWQDINGVLYTDRQGNSIINWNKAEETTLYSKWEKMEYTVTFVTNGGSSVDAVTLEYGARLDLNRYVTTRSNYTFSGWYESASDMEAYSAGTMPDHNLTLYAKWTTFALGTIKYDEFKTAISVNDSVNEALFSAICLDTNGELATFTTTISGTQTQGNTVSIRLVATSGNKTKQTTISGVKVYGMPTLTIENDNADYVNLVDGLTATYFRASGIDTYGVATKINVSVNEGNAGDVGSILIQSIDVAGNITSQVINNIKLYGTPTITYDTAKTEISIYDTIDSNLFMATAVDSFDEILNVSVAVVEGSIIEASEVTLRLNATDSKGNITNIDIKAKVYGAPVISDATIVEFTENDVITVQAMGINATDTYGKKLDITLTLSEGVQTGGQVLTYLASVSDVAGNITTKEYFVKIYGKPSITYSRDAITVVEDVTKIDTVTIQFNLNGGQGKIASQTISNTVGLKYPEIPQRNGYVFRGWYTTSSCTDLFDFSASVKEDTTVYAGWRAMVTSNYSNRDVIDILSNYNSSDNAYSLSNADTSSSAYYYTYFTALTSGTYNLYYKNSSSSSNYGTYLYVYNVTQSSTIKSNTNCYSTAYTKISFSAKAGDVIYIRNYRYNTSYSATFDFYVTGGKTPNIGGTTATDSLKVSAVDSFGNALAVAVELKSGQLIGGTYVVYTLSAKDHLDNAMSIDVRLKVYDWADINLTYSNMASDLIKLSSKGEEFLASATDSFGDSCNIKIVAAEGFSLQAGQIIDLYIVAYDAAGNAKSSELISNIKVYGEPVVKYQGETNQYTIKEDDDISFLFAVFDSFGEEIYTQIDTDDMLVAGSIINVRVYAQDDAGNIVNNIYQVYVEPKDEQSFVVELYVFDSLYSTKFLNANILSLPVISIDSYLFKGWIDENSNNYTDESGNVISEISSNIKLYASLELIQKINYVELYVGDKLWQSVIIDDAVDYRLPMPQKDGFLCVWQDFENNVYTDINGVGTDSLKNITRLKIAYYPVGYTPIFTAEQLSNLSVSGKYILLADIDLNGIEWTPVGTDAKPFVGIFDGNNYCISNFSIGTVYTSDWPSRTYRVGFIGVNEGTIKNLSLKNYSYAKISTSVSYPSVYIGSIAAYNNGTISNCSSESTISLSFYYSGISSLSVLVGGLVGANKGEIEKCYALVGITCYPDTISRSFHTIGGLAGSNSGTIRNCYASGSISSRYAAPSNGGQHESDVGGLIGYMGDGLVENCYSNSSVSAYVPGCSSPKAYVGGLIGDISGGTVNNAFATGTVSSKYAYFNLNAGGLFGNNTSGNSNNCYRSSTQSITGATINQNGEVVELETLTSEKFQKDILGWDPNIWIFMDGYYPTIK